MTALPCSQVKTPGICVYASVVRLTDDSQESLPFLGTDCTYEDFLDDVCNHWFITRKREDLCLNFQDYSLLHADDTDDLTDAPGHPRLSSGCIIASQEEWEAYWVTRQKPPTFEDFSYHRPAYGFTIVPRREVLPQHDRQADPRVIRPAPRKRLMSIADLEELEAQTVTPPPPSRSPSPSISEVVDDESPRKRRA